jgi:plastocyanin
MTYDVGVTTFAYLPRDLTVVEGDSVRWYWIQGTHTITEGLDCTAQDPLFDSLSDPTHPELIYRFDTAGFYEYFCRLHCVIDDMKGSVTVLGAGAVPGNGNAAARFSLWTEPNPTPGEMVIHLAGPVSGWVRVEIIDAAGRLVRELERSGTGSGRPTMPWDGLDEQGRRVPAGVYVIRQLSAGRALSTTAVVTR